MLKWLENNKSIVWIILILLTIEIFYFSSLTGGTGTGGSPWVARSYHLIVFFLFNFFLLAALKGTKKIKLRYVIMIITISIIHAILDEIHQIFVPFRDASFRDIFTDTLGIFISTIIYLFINKKSS